MTSAVACARSAAAWACSAAASADCAVAAAAWASASATSASALDGWASASAVSASAVDAWASASAVLAVSAPPQEAATSTTPSSAPVLRREDRTIRRMKSFPLSATVDQRGSVADHQPAPQRRSNSPADASASVFPVPGRRAKGGPSQNGGGAPPEPWRAGRGAARLVRSAQAHARASSHWSSGYRSASRGISFG